jgi:hypothetical protein
MSQEEKYLKSIGGLLDLVDKVVEAFPIDGKMVIRNEQDYSNVSESKASTSQLALTIYGATSSFYLSCLKAGSEREAYIGPALRGILLGMKQNIEEGYLRSARREIMEEFTGDYLGMANNLNERDGLHIAAAVIAGTTLEERVRQLARLHLTSDLKGNGEPESVESLNVKLKGFYNAELNDQRLVTKEYGIRTQAAHAQWNSDSEDPKAKEDHKRMVALMIKNIEDFLKRNPA